MQPLPETASRRIRRRVLSWLPSRHRARLRRVYERTTAPAVRATATFHDEGSTIIVAIADGPTVRIFPECRPAIERQFTDPEAAAEFGRFMQYAARPGTLFDVGANNGLFALVYCLGGPGHRAVAFEPSPPLADIIRRLAALNGVDARLAVVEKAVAESVGQRDLLLDDRGGYVQSAAFAGTTDGAWRTLQMPTTTLDDELERQLPTLVKIDIEGYEHEALLGAGTLLTRIRPTILLELHLNYLNARRIAPSQVVAILSRHGYELATLTGQPRSGRDIDRSWASVLHLVATPADR
jgi:FkbM family methyltransferase